MHKAVRVFNLTLVEHDSEGGGMAIWDGTGFVFEQASGSYWDLFKMFWRCVNLLTLVSRIEIDERWIV